MFRKPEYGTSEYRQWEKEQRELHTTLRSTLLNDPELRSEDSRYSIFQTNHLHIWSLNYSGSQRSFVSRAMAELKSRHKSGGKSALALLCGAMVMYYDGDAERQEIYLRLELLADKVYSYGDYRPDVSEVKTKCGECSAPVDITDENGDLHPNISFIGEKIYAIARTNSTIGIICQYCNAPLNMNGVDYEK